MTRCNTTCEDCKGEVEENEMRRQVCPYRHSLILTVAHTTCYRRRMKRTPKLKTLPVWMRENGVTISAMAEEMDVSHMTVRRYMAGSVIPTVENMCKIKKITKGEVIADSFYPYCDAA